MDSDCFLITGGGEERASEFIRHGSYFPYTVQRKFKKMEADAVRTVRTCTQSNCVWRRRKGCMIRFFP